MRLPGRIVLPFGYSVRVKQVTDTEMRAHCGDERGEPISADGLWEEPTRTIFIRKCLPIRRKSYILTHELIHAFADFQHHHLNTGDARP